MIRIRRILKYLIAGAYIALMIHGMLQNTYKQELLSLEGMELLKDGWEQDTTETEDSIVRYRSSIMLPKKQCSMPSLLVASVYSEVTIRLDGTEIYRFDAGIDGGKTSRMVYLIVDLPSDYDGKKLEIDGIPSADLLKGSNPPVLLGERHELIYGMIRREIPNLLSGILLLILGIVFTLDTYILQLKFKIKVKETASMSAASLFAGGWLITESRMFCQLVSDYVSAYYINYCCFYLLIIKLVEFLGESGNKKVDKRINKLGLVYRSLFVVGVVGEITYTVQFYKLQQVMLAAVIGGLGMIAFWMLKDAMYPENMAKIILSLLFFLTSVLDGVFLYHKIYTLEDGILCVQIASIILIIYIVIRVGLFFLKAIQEDVLNQALKLHLETQVQHYENMLQEQRKSAIYRHDNKTRFLSLYTMVEQGKKEETKDYLQKLLEKIDQESQKEIVGSPVLDAILWQKKNEAYDNGVEFSAELDIPRDLEIGPDDWVAVMGNLLDNAMEACMQVKVRKRNITVRMSYQKGLLVMEVKNSVQNVSIVFEKTTKDMRAGHGYGLMSIRQAIKKYDGDFHIEAVGRQCKAVVMLKCKAESLL